MRKFAFFVCFAIAFVTAQAQSVITGVVKNTDGKKISNASVTVEESGKTAILAYAITNANGAYKLTVNSAATELNLKVKAFNHKPTVKKVSNKTQTQNFIVSQKVTEIKEVIIKSKLITKKGDTISYNLNKFASKNDRTLADVLKKMPGMEVKSDGTVLYQGEPINKFYVEGKDLMEGGYGLLTKSLPKDAISKLQVMENHQPVKILKDKVPSDRAAINIKLKRKVTMTGRGEVGVGMSPLLWNVKLTPMLLTKKNQWLINYKANNVGEEVEQEGNILSFGSRWEGRRTQASSNGWLNVEGASRPNVPVKRYLMNNVHYLSGNLLTNPFKNKEWELKANASYSNNSVERKSESFTNYNDGLSIARNVANNTYSNQAKTELIFSKNGEKGFFKNTTTFTGFWNDDRANVYRKDRDGSEINADERVKSPTLSFANSLSTIIPIKEKLVNVMSYISYQKDQQNLRFTPANYLKIQNNANAPNSIVDNFNFDNYKGVHQNFNLKTIDVNHSASVGFSYKKFTITPEVSLDMNFNEMDSKTNLFDDQENETYLSQFVNQNTWNTFKSTGNLRVNYKGDRFSMYLRLPTNYYDIMYRDQLRNNRMDFTKTTFEPSLFAQYEFASFFKLRGYGSINYRFGDISSIYEGYILNSPQSIGAKATNDIMPETKTQNIGTTLAYRNPLNNLFFNIRYNYFSLNNNVMSQFNPAEVNVVNYVAQDTRTQNKSQSVEVGKYFPKIKTNLSVTGSNRDSNSFFYNFDLNQNDFKLSESKVNSQSLGVKFNNTYFSWLSVDYNFSHSWSKNNRLGQDIKSKNWEHDLSAFIYPSDNHTFGFIFNQTNSELGGKRYSNPFFDASYQYTWTKRNIDFELKWMNIANTKVFERVNVGNQFISTSRVNIRPSQFMFTVKFNFK